MQQSSKNPRSHSNVCPTLWEKFVHPLFFVPSTTWAPGFRQTKVQAAAGEAARRVAVRAMQESFMVVVCFVKEL